MKHFLSLSLVMVFGLGIMAKPKTLRMTNWTGEGFIIHIQAFSPDSVLNIPFLRVSGPDTIIHLDVAMDCAVLVLMDTHKHLQVSLPVYLDQPNTVLAFGLSKEVSVPQAYSGMTCSGGKGSMEFFGITRTLITDAVQEVTIDTARSLRLLDDHLKKFPRNHLAVWMKLQLLLPGHPEYAGVYRRVSSCRACRNVFLQGRQETDPVFRETEVLYDSLTWHLDNRSIHLSGPPVQIKDHDTATLIFWASWCKPCIEHILQMSTEERSSLGTVFYSIDLDSAAARKWINKLGLGSGVYLLSPKELEHFGYRHIPLTLLALRKERMVAKVE